VIGVGFDTSDVIDELDVSDVVATTAAAKSIIDLRSMIVMCGLCSERL